MILTINELRVNISGQNLIKVHIQFVLYDKLRKDCR